MRIDPEWEGTPIVCGHELLHPALGHGYHNPEEGYLMDAGVTGVRLGADEATRLRSAYGLDFPPPTPDQGGAGANPGS